MLRDEIEQYTKLTGEDGWHVPIMKVGAYLDGYNKGLEVLDKLRAEIEKLNPVDYGSIYSYESHYGAREMQNDVLDIIDKYK